METIVAVVGYEAEKDQSEPVRYTTRDQVGIVTDSGETAETRYHRKTGFVIKGVDEISTFLDNMIQSPTLTVLSIARFAVSAAEKPEPPVVRGELETFVASIIRSALGGIVAS